MSEQKHRNAAREYYAQTYQKGRAQRQKSRPHEHADDYYAQTYRQWREHGRGDGDDPGPFVPLGMRLRHRYASRRWLLALDLLLALTLSQALLWGVVRSGFFQNLSRVPHSMNEARDSPYTRALDAEMERERRAMEQRNRLRGSR